jgi:FkbM family methyltransferase
MNIIERSAQVISTALGRDSTMIRALRPFYETFLQIQSLGRGVKYELNGIKIYIEPRYRKCFKPFFDPTVAEFLNLNVRNNDLCLDIGAQVGVYTLQMAHWTRPHGKIISFEPNPEAARALERHILLNRLKDRVKIIPAAIGQTTGSEILFTTNVSGAGRLNKPAPLLEVEGPVSKHVVTVLTLDDYCESEQLSPDWIKLDIEGYEFAALASARRLIQRRGKNLKILVEMHPQLWHLVGTTRAEAERLISELNLRLTPLTGQTDPLGEIGHICLESA